MRKEEFMSQIADCKLPDHFDEHLLDHAASMFGQWGLSRHMSEQEHLFEKFGLDDRKDDSLELKSEKQALRCIAQKLMKMQVSREDASELMKNLNRIRDPSYISKLWG